LQAVCSKLRTVQTLAFVSGLALIVVGVGLVSVSAALIVGGATLTMCAVLYARGR